MGLLQPGVACTVGERGATLSTESGEETKVKGNIHRKNLKRKERQHRTQTSQEALESVGQNIPNARLF